MNHLLIIQQVNIIIPVDYEFCNVIDVSECFKLIFAFVPIVMETEVTKVPAKKKEPSKRTAALKKPLATVSEISSDDEENDVDDEDFDLEIVAAPEKGKKGGRKPAANAKAAAKPPAVAKNGGAGNKQKPQTLSQKLISDMLKPAENLSGISPEKKVRKMRASPFNKKSGSVLGRAGEANESTEAEEILGSASTSGSTEEIVEVAPAKSRPQRVNRTQKRYVVSDSESENATEDSDFEEEEED